jgi:hypothetical protein
MTKDDISPFKALDFIRDHAEEYAIAKANVVYMTEFRKSIKATLMTQCDAKTQTEKESFAYSHPTYIQHLDNIRVAVEECEKMRWLMIGAEAKISVWQSLNANERAELKYVATTNSND